MSDRPQAPPPGPLAGSTAVILMVLAILAAVGIGLAAGRVARQPPPTPPIVTFTPAPTPAPTPVDEDALMRQPLSSGCATDASIWVVTNGGGLLRFDGEHWAQADATLRSLTRVACRSDAAYAVGLVGSFVVMDELAHEIRSNAITIDDLFGVGVTGGDVLMVGSRGAVFIDVAGQVNQYAKGITEDLRAIVAFSRTSAWAVGAAGVVYRLDDRGWSTVAAPTTDALNAVAATTPADAVAVGDAGTIIRYDGGWKTVASGVDVALRDVLVGPQLWIAGDRGTLLTGTLAALHPVDLHTTCDLVSVFTTKASGDVWVVGESAGAGAVWRLHGGAVAKKWGGC